MTTASEVISPFGEQLRFWRRKRGLSQLGLATEADISSRHLSFIETGRSRPSREMVVHLASVMDVPLRHRNVLLKAAGFTPAYHARELSAPEMAPVAAALRFMLEKSEPYPAVVIDRLWSVVITNHAMAHLSGWLGLSPPPDDGQPTNLLAACFDPDGLRPLIVNWEQVAFNIISRLHREVASGGPNDEVRTLIDTLLSYSDVPSDWHALDPAAETDPMICVELEQEGIRLRFFSLISTFGTPNDITLQELRVENMFPADESTDQFLRALAGSDAG